MVDFSFTPLVSVLAMSRPVATACAKSTLSVSARLKKLAGLTR